MARLILTAPALRDLEEIQGSVSSDRVTAGRTWLTRIQQLCISLSEMPQMGRERPELGEGVRSMPVAAYGVFYREAMGGIEIIRVLHGSSDADPAFQ